ncbi:uncharacterized protein TM35_000073260 [Trypanosoma theileri]|uniref:Kelch repeat-containing protein n=1 Tax=Trypanosoma theileri TaxID=67003 RepID=A0A1X0P1X0_9TRYP|nr:uncharacterized protein TM35_000073260 [Trypanosoma theileri]ORC90902.1 hypothetical protein TM35_000073260 [Trypanosoma theileri]
MDCTAPPHGEGMTLTLCENDLYAVGPSEIAINTAVSHPEVLFTMRVARLHPETRVWTITPCTGAVPPAHRYHTAVFFAQHLLVCGGEPLTPHAHTQSTLMPYYELVLDTLTWMRVDTFGAIPLNRSHHSCSVVGESMIIFGGKPIVCDARNHNDALTNERMDACDRAGFYDVFVLDIVSRVWRAVQPFGPLPQLWGHSSVVYGDTHLLVFGGLDVSQRKTAAISKYKSQHHPHDPPIAKVSGALYVLDVHEMSWRVVLPETEKGEEEKKEDLIPLWMQLPRAMHTALVDGDNMFVIGGFRVDTHGKIVLLNDMWIYNILEGTWNEMEFQLPLPPALRRPSSMYESQILILPNMNSFWYLDVHKQAREHVWREIPTTCVTISVQPATATATEIGRAEEYSEILNPRHSNNGYEIPTSREEYEDLSSPKPSRAVQFLPIKKLNLIIDEIHKLQEIVVSQKNTETTVSNETEKSMVTTTPAEAGKVTEELEVVKSSSEQFLKDEEKKRLREKAKQLKKQKERIDRLTERLSQLIEHKRLNEIKESTVSTDLKHQQSDEKTFQEMRPFEEVKDPFEYELKNNGQLEKSSELLLPLNDMISSEQQEQEREENQKDQQKDVNRSCSSQPEDSDRWSKLIEIMNQSPSRPSERAFRASVISL